MLYRAYRLSIGVYRRFARPGRYIPGHCLYIQPSCVLRVGIHIVLTTRPRRTTPGLAVQNMRL